jgi:hypothetical protein
MFAALPGRRVTLRPLQNLSGCVRVIDRGGGTQGRIQVLFAWLPPANGLGEAAKLCYLNDIESGRALDSFPIVSRDGATQQAIVFRAPSVFEASTFSKQDSPLRQEFPASRGPHDRRRPESFPLAAQSFQRLTVFLAAS